MFLIYENDNHFNIGYYNTLCKKKILNNEKVSSNLQIKETKNVYIKKDLNIEEKEFHLKDLKKCL